MASWMTGGHGLTALIDVNADLAAKFFDTPDGFVIDGTPPAGWATNVVKSWNSYAAYEKTGLATYPWLLYDPEKWTHTPLIEQEQPRYYLRKFATLAHHRGSKVIETPARDLCQVPGGDFHVAGLGMDAAYLRTKVAAACADADIFECQAQPDQEDKLTHAETVARYVHLVRGAKAQARPGQPFWCGLTTMRPGNTAAQLIDCHAAVADVVDGWWLNTTTATIGMIAEFLAQVTP